MVTNIITPKGQLNTGLKCLVVGTGRCGTGYIARVFNRAGVTCGHESVFTVDGFVTDHKYTCDASWLAVPFLPSVSDDTLIVHQIRNPLLTLGSLAAIEGLFGERLNAYGKYIRHMLPEAYEFNGVERAACFYLHWTCWIQAYRNVFWRVEDLDEDVTKLAFVLNEACGAKLTPEEIGVIVQAVPTDVNHYRVRRIITEESLGRFSGAFLKHMEDYGYV